MAEFFGKGISVGSGFDLGANLPLDNRTVQATIAELWFNAYYSVSRRPFSICKGK